MIDVVFLLIIFFLVSSHIARQENRLPVDLPVAKSFQNIDPESVSLTVTIDTDGQWRLGGGIIDDSALGGALTEALARDGSAASLRIRTDGVVPYQRVEPILRTAARVGVYDVSIAVRDASSS